MANKYRTTCIFIILISSLFFILMFQNFNSKSSEWGHLSSSHASTKHRQRRILVNNDGNDIFSSSNPLNDSNIALKLFTKNRLQELGLNIENNQIDSLFYETTGGGFGGFSHPNKIGDFRNNDMIVDGKISKYALNKYLDPLKETIKYVRSQGRNREVFWSMRMNDTHDSSDSNGWNDNLFSTFKKENPDLLFAVSMEQQQNLKAGRWTSVNYAATKVRRFVTDSVADVLDRYDVDGIQLNFMRHAIFFPRNAMGSAANKIEIEKMTSMMREIRIIADLAASKRKKPILVTILIPDSVAYNLYLGLDTESWYKEKLVDLVVAGDYMQLSPWENSVTITKKYDIPFYAGFTIPRLELNPNNPPLQNLRMTAEAYRGRALEALAKGVDGIHLYNSNWNSKIYQSLYYDIGNKNLIASKDFIQFACYMGKGDNPGRIPDYSSYFIQAPVAPDTILKLVPNQSYQNEFQIGANQKHVSIYIRTEDLTTSQKNGLLYIRILKNKINPEIVIKVKKYYMETPSSLIDPVKMLKANKYVYRPRMLRFDLPASVIDSSSLKMQLVNDSNSVVIIEDIFLQATKEAKLPDILDVMQFN